MDIHIPTKGGIQKMLCMPLKKLNGWLFSVNPAKVKVGIHDIVVTYQEECFVALYDYWHKGVAINPRAFPKETLKPEALSDITIKLLADETESAFSMLRKKYAVMGNQGRLTINATYQFCFEDGSLELPDINLSDDSSEEYLTPTELGKKLGCSAKKVNKLLLENGLQVSFRDAKGELCYEPTEKGIPYAVFGDSGKKLSKTKRKKRLLWKKSVLGIIS